MSVHYKVLSGWGSFDDALPGYAGALGAAGMARYEELLAHAQQPARKYLDWHKTKVFIA